MNNILSLTFSVAALTLLIGCKPCCEKTAADTKAAGTTTNPIANEETRSISTETEAKNAEKPSIKNLSADEFKKSIIDEKKSAIVKFTAHWCGACKDIQPLFEELAQNFSSKYTFVAIDLDQANDLAKEYNVQGIPTFLFFKDGKEVNADKRIVGSSITKEQFTTAIEENLQDATVSAAA